MPSININSACEPKANIFCAAIDLILATGSSKK